MSASWLNKAIFYEIYPQSFYDSNGDGIGDIPGITQKLDYVKSLGCNAIWINPCFDSPFKDAGYDVRDYKKVAPRYGTNADLEELFRVAHTKGMHILLDLVPGHTSEEHPWFRESCKDEKNEFTDRFIWTNDAFARGDGMPFIGGESPRDATYILNFFKCQPALNYGYNPDHIHESWQQRFDDPAPLATREAIKDVMRFWLDRGCDGFRVDMADSLVKNDGDGRPYTMAVWQDILGQIHREYPEAAFVSEWNMPHLALNCGFDMDFYLNWGGNGYSILLRNYEMPKFGDPVTDDRSYFKADANTDMQGFLADYLPKYEQSRQGGRWCFITCNHDTPRIAPTLDDRERRLAFAFLFTMPGVPFLYYGDEIGMPYRWLPSKEGGYKRTGSRTPMQWTNGRNMGFSTAAEDALYLPVEQGPEAVSVAQQEENEQSFLNFTRSLIAMRQAHEDLNSAEPFQVYDARPGSRLFAYKRGGLLLAVNPSREALELELDGQYRTGYTVGTAQVTGKTLHLDAQSFVLLEPEV